MQMHCTLRRRIAPLLVLPLLAAGCDDFLDVNEDPNSAEFARVDLRLPAIIAGFGHSVLFGSTMLWGTEWMQQYSYNNDTRSYSEVQRYELSAVDPNNPWNFAFATVMKESRLIMMETEAAEDWAYHGIAKFIFAWSYSFVTDMWGPVPFAEAFDTNIPDPVYDEQQVVYEGIHTMLEEAIAAMQRPAARVPGENDLLFGGDMARWVKLARTVQARLHLRLAYAPGENPQERAQQALTALQQGIASSADEALFLYPGGENGARTPFWTFDDIEDFVASEYFVELLRGLDDPRLPLMVTPVPIELPNIVYRGHKNGGPEEADSTHSRIASVFSGDSADLTWLSYADVKFIEAEARLIASGAAAADAPYRAGIRAHMEKLGVAPADITAYLAARPSLATVADPLEEIIQQKYIANFLNIEAWNDFRRTGFPHLELVERAVLTGIPQRIRTPGSELSNNAENVAATGIPTGLDGMNVKVWWASQGPQ